MSEHAHGGLPCRPRCSHCGDIIGVFEPLVVSTPDGTREASLAAADPHLAAADDASYHRACSELLAGNGID